MRRLLTLLAALLLTPLFNPAGPAAAGPSQPQTPAYWLVAADGGIFPFGGAPFSGSAGGTRLNSPVVGMAGTADGQGYWLVAADGGVFAYGDAVFYGAPSRIAAPAAAIAATPDGHGYWIVTTTGVVYPFGDALPGSGLLGSTPPSKIVGIAPTPDGGGYWLASAGGGVYALGDAPFEGSAGNVRLAKPVVGLASTTTGNGYWLVASDGGIFSYGDAAFRGSTGGIVLNRPIVGMAATATGSGYWLVASDGGIFSYDAPFRGSTGGLRLNQPIVGMAVSHLTVPYPAGQQGYDVSFPQCGGPLPAQPFAFGIVGINDGRAFTNNPCLATQAAWAGSAGTAYINLNAPPAGTSHATTGPAGNCTATQLTCLAYNYGYNAAANAFDYGTSQGVNSAVWWLDIETANSWDADKTNNDFTIRGALDALTARGVVPGIYSTSTQWAIIAGGFAPQTPIWVATGADRETAIDFCAPSHAFGGGTTWLTQYGTQGVAYDQDYACL